MSWRSARWQLGTAVLKAGQGGIARVARMTTRALLDNDVDADFMALLDETPTEIGGRLSTTARRSRLAYAAGCHVAAFAHERFLYDSVGMARAHPRIGALRRPYGVWIHGVEVWDSLSSGRARALREADFVLVNSQFTLDRFQQLHWRLDNAYVCRLATEDNEPPFLMPQFSGPPTALLIGRSDKNNFRKGHMEVVESWARVTRAIPNAELLLVGGGDGLSLLRDTVARSPAASQIRILGFVSEEEMPGIWERAHVFVQPSWKEGFGLVYIEAMRHALPVIASIHDAGQEVNEDGVTGYNVDLNDSQMLADRLVDLFRNPDSAQRLGRAGQERWRQHFRYRAFRDRLVDTLDRIHGQ